MPLTHRPPYRHRTATVNRIWTCIPQWTVQPSTGSPVLKDWEHLVSQRLPFRHHSISRFLVFSDRRISLLPAFLWAFAPRELVCWTLKRPFLGFVDQQDLNLRQGGIRRPLYRLSYNPPQMSALKCFGTRHPVKSVIAFQYYQSDWIYALYTTFIRFLRGPHGNRTRHLRIAKPVSPHCDFWPIFRCTDHTARKGFSFLGESNLPETIRMRCRLHTF